MLRRLAISATILIPNALIQLSVCLALCLLFLFHQTHVKPFRHSVSNLAEGFSLSLLCAIAAINLLKAAFLYTELNPQGPQVEILTNLELLEIMFVVVLILFVVCFEAYFAIMLRVKNRIVKQEWHHMLPLARLAPGNHQNVMRPDTRDSEEDVETVEGIALETIIHDNPGYAREETVEVPADDKKVEVKEEGADGLNEM